MPLDRGLREIRVVDLTRDIAGAYATKLFCDAGAEVLQVELPGEPGLRAVSATGSVAPGEEGALFRFLSLGKTPVRAEGLEDAALAEWISGADLVVESLAPGAVDPEALAAKEPGLCVLSISPFGRTGPDAGRPATEFTVQAASGSLGTRGLAGKEPFQAGGRTIEWLAGTFAAVAGVAAVHRAQQTGHGECVDFSIAEVTNIGGTNYADLMCAMLGVPAVGGLPQSVETPSIEPTKDGWVGFCTNSRQQVSDFMLLIGRPDLQDDEVLAQVAGRMARFDEWNEIVHTYTKEHTTAEIVEAASLLRIPVAPVNDGKTVQEHEQLVARGVFREQPASERGPGFVHPRPPYRIDFEDPPVPRVPEPPAPRTRSLPAPKGRPGLPLEGIRIIDMTAWWAGPSSTHMLACLGADVIHVESCGRPDGMRMVGGMLAGKFSDWWEASSFYLAANSNKRGLTLDLSKPAGRDALLRLVAQADAVVENFTPRVLENFDLGWETLHAANTQAILLRMPAFGLSGPWRDNTGFAQTMEQLTGLAWLTGHADDQPRIQRGPCDPLAGMHAAFAFIVALQEREARGEGVHVECTMVEGALNAASEQVIEFSAYGKLLEREGNRSPVAAPQGLYACAAGEPGVPSWLALSVATDAQWQALVGWLGNPDWATDPRFADHAGRRAGHDAIDEALRGVFAARERERCCDELLAAGVPVAVVSDPRAVRDDPQLTHRRFFEAVDHPVVGRQWLPGQPFRYASVPQWIRGAAPTLGQHNREILEAIGGYTPEEVDALERDGVIGSRPEGL